MGGVHTPRVPLDQQPLRLGDGYLFARVRHSDAFRRTFRRQTRHQERLFMEYRHMVGGRLPPCRVRCGDGVVCRPARRRGHACRRRQRRAHLAHSVHIPDAVHPRAVCPRHRRGGQLPCCEQGHSRVFPQEGPRLCHQHLQCRIDCRGSCGAVHHPDACGTLRLGGLVHHNRSFGLRMDGFLAVHV